MTPSESLAPRTDETRALTRLAFDELSGFPYAIGQVHKAVADRVFRALGPVGRPVQIAHDTLSGGVYAGLRGATRGLGTAAERGLLVTGRTTRPLSTTPRGAAAIAALNGLIGDVLEQEGSVLHQPMAVRVGGHALPLDRDALSAAYPDATPRLVVFLHGLMETEFAWSLGGRETYGSRLKADLACTPVYVRYNTGRHISENGRSLCELLQELADAWPEPVEEIALVGHSMGGLVARSACHWATMSGAGWVRDVRHVVSLGSPHMGAPLEQAVHYASAALHALPETRPLGSFLRRRSGGIRDLRQGSLVDEDWRELDRDALKRVACQEVPLLEGATHCFVAATVTRSPRHPVGRIIGDCLVLEPSASGRSRTRRIPFKAEHGAHLGGTHHLALLNHPAVYPKLRDWLAASPAMPSA
jgi:pimeloyl-ACP methyl ester carboxylesterase